MKTLSPGIFLIVLLAATVAGRAEEMKLVARYDWTNGAADVSGFPVHHDGVLDPAASISGGKLKVAGCDGVEIAGLRELQGATTVLIRFEDVTFTSFPSGTPYRYSALAGEDNGTPQWWVGARFELPPFGSRTSFRFNLGGWDQDVFQEIDVRVADSVVTHFDSIEFRYDGSAKPGERIGIRWNDGFWTTAGWASPASFPVFPRSGGVRINDGCQADWDHMEGTMGTVSFSADAKSVGGVLLPGDANGDASLDLSDAVWLIGHLFLGNPETATLPCEGGTTTPGPGEMKLLDFNGDGKLDVTDVVAVLGYLYQGKAPHVLGTACFPIPGCPDRCGG